MSVDRHIAFGAAMSAGGSGAGRGAPGAEAGRTAGLPGFATVALPGCRLYDLYSFQVLPALAAWSPATPNAIASRRKHSRFPPQDELAALMTGGARAVRYRNLSGASRAAFRWRS